MKKETPENRFSGGVSCARRRGLFAARDADRQLRRDFRMDPNRDMRLAERLDRLVEVDPPTLDLDALASEEFGDVLGRHGAEELAFLGSLAALLVRQGL